MNNGAVIAAAGLLAFGAWWAYRNSGEGTGIGGEAVSGWVQDISGEVVGAVQGAVDWLGGDLRLSRMRDVRADMLGNQNVQAMLKVIRAGEGTADSLGYRRLVGGGEFASFADHPRMVRSGDFANGTTWRSSAAGAYQFIESTWDETRRIMGLPDFTPASQDLAAVGRIAARGALADVIEGRFDVAVSKLAREWASLPGSPYGQPTISAELARAIYAAAGGTAIA